MLSEKEKEYIAFEINKWLMSKTRKDQITALDYYNGLHDIRFKTRAMKDPEGKQMDMQNLPNHRITNNLTSFCVDQKSDYMFSKPIKVTTKMETYRNHLKKILNAKFMRTFKSLGKDSVNCGIGWLYPFVDEGELKFKRLSATEMLPFWKDCEHTELNYAVRFYEVLEPMSVKTTEKVEIFTEEGIEYYIWNGARLIPENKSFSPYHKIILSGEMQKRVELGANWGRIPLIPFKSNGSETPLLNRIKSLQDAINSIMSIHQDNLAEDMRSTILVIQNYDGTDLAEFRHNLAAAGAIKVSTVDGISGGVEPLRIEVDSKNYEVVLKELKRALFNGARCFDPSDELMNSRPNELNLRALYSSINLDSNEMESEYRASFETVIWFINTFLKFRGDGDYFDEDVQLTFDRDMIIDESARIQSFVMTKGLIPDKYAFARHPWIDDVEEALEEQKRQDAEAQADALMGLGTGGKSDGEQGTGREVRKTPTGN